MTLTPEQLWQIQCGLAGRLSSLQSAPIQIDNTLQKLHVDQLLKHTSEALQIIKAEYERVAI